MCGTRQPVAAAMCAISVTLSSSLVLAHLILPFTALLLPSTTTSPSFSAGCCTSAGCAAPASCPELVLLPAPALLLPGCAAWAAGLQRWLDGSWLAAACTAACMLSCSNPGELSTLPSSCQRLQPHTSKGSLHVMCCFDDDTRQRPMTPPASSPGARLANTTAQPQCADTHMI